MAAQGATGDRGRRGRFRRVRGFRVSGPSGSGHQPVAPHLTRRPLSRATGGQTIRLNLEKEEVRIAYNEMRSYPEGGTVLLGVKVVTERGGGRTFTITANQGEVGQNEATYLLTATSRSPRPTAWSSGRIGPPGASARRPCVRRAR